MLYVPGILSVHVFGFLKAAVISRLVFINVCVLLKQSKSLFPDFMLHVAHYGQLHYIWAFFWAQKLKSFPTVLST